MKRGLEDLDFGLESAFAQNIVLFLVSPRSLRSPVLVPLLWYFYYVDLWFLVFCIFCSSCHSPLLLYFIGCVHWGLQFLCALHHCVLLTSTFCTERNHDPARWINIISSSCKLHPKQSGPIFCCMNATVQWIWSPGSVYPLTVTNLHTFFFLHSKIFFREKGL